MLKKISSYTFILLGLILLNSCKKEYDSAEIIDDAKIADYISKHNITNAVKDSTGYYYQILNEGTGDFYLNTDSVLYNGSVKSLLNGTTYYSSPATSNLGTKVGYASQFYLGLSPSGQSIVVNIQAIRSVLAKLKPGGSARIMLPSSLVFKKNGDDDLNVPSNEIIDFNLITYADKSQSERDDSLIREFIAAKGITDVKDTLGIYYVISNEGTGSNEIDLGTTFKANYTGKYLDGTTFDASTDASLPFILSSTIEAWHVIIPKLKQGGKVRMIVPSTLGYSTTGNNAIPPNTILDFDVEITEITN